MRSQLERLLPKNLHFCHSSQHSSNFALLCQLVAPSDISISASLIWYSLVFCPLIRFVVRLHPNRKWPQTQKSVASRCIVAVGVTCACVSPVSSAAGHDSFKSGLCLFYDLIKYLTNARNTWYCFGFVCLFVSLLIYQRCEACSWM